MGKEGDERKGGSGGKAIGREGGGAKEISTQQVVIVF